MSYNEMQDLGDLSVTLRSVEETGPSSVEPLIPDDGFVDATEAFREVLDEHFSEHIDQLAEDGERIVVERLMIRSDDIPYIEYTVVDER